MRKEIHLMASFSSVQAWESTGKQPDGSHGYPHNTQQTWCHEASHRLTWDKRERMNCKWAVASFSSNRMLPLLALTLNSHLGFYFDRFPDALKTFVHCNTRFHNKERFLKTHKIAFGSNTLSLTYLRYFGLTLDRGEE